MFQYLVFKRNEPASFCRFFEDSKYDELRLKFYEYMVELGLHDENYLEICKHYRAVYDTTSIQADQVSFTESYKNFL